MKSVAIKRICKDLGILLEEIRASGCDRLPGACVILSACSEETFKWTLEVAAPTDSVYGSSKDAYKLEVLFPEDYPHEPPTVRFVTSLYNPLVSTTGSVCGNIVRSMWSPDQRAADAITAVLEKVFCEYENHCSDDVFPEARSCLEQSPLEFAARVRQKE